MQAIAFRSLALVLSCAAVAALGTGSATAQSEFAAVSEDGQEQQLALIRETVRVTIDQQYAQTRIRQVFHNRTEGRLEGRYQLRLGEGARVDGFAYWNGEHKIVGEVFEKQTAEQVYEEVTGLDRDPGLLEQNGEGAFSFRVFPIEPDERKPVEVYYGQWLGRDGNTVTYRIPVGSEDSQVEIRIADERGVSQVTSKTHELDIQTRDKDGVVVRAGGMGADGELLLSYRVGGPDWAVSAFVHRDAGHDAYLVATLAAPEGLGDGAVAAKDVTLVLDRSGSMSGDPLDNAKVAAQAVVKRLRDGDRLNVIAFDHEVDALLPAPEPVDDESKARALDYIGKLRPSGGTNIAQALERALAAQHPPDGETDRPHVILFLTDGQSSAQEALKVARADQGDARVFTIGVGSGVEKPLLSRLASEKRGRFTFIESPSAIEPKVSRLYAQIAAPVLVGVSIDIAGDIAGQDARLMRTYPRSMPDLFRGDEIVVTSRAAGAGPVKLIVRGEMAGKPMTFERTVTLAKQVSRPWVGRMWAQARVDDLLEEIALFGETEELKNEATNLAVAYNFVTQYTSFLAIPESELTDSARDALESAREHKQRILAAHEDAVALSRSAMPPGDPILQIRAPRDAMQVTAYFPFGLVKDLAYDADTEQWRVRFLVPKHVPDGDYTVKIVVVHADGTIEVAHVPYTIDSSEPDFDVRVRGTPGGVRVEVTTAEQARLVTVAVVGDPLTRVELTPRGDGHTFDAVLPIAAGSHQLRVVVADTARNEAEQTVAVEVLR